MHEDRENSREFKWKFRASSIGVEGTGTFFNFMAMLAL